MAKMLANYRYELDNKPTFIDSNGRGFATYEFLNDLQAVYIEDIYVEPAYRQQNVASEMADAIVEIAKAKGYKTLIGSVRTNIKNPTRSMKVLLAYGFEIDSCDGKLIWLKKDLGV